MSTALLMLPTLLAEGSVHSQQKKGYWKPSVAESMEHFVDLQKVHIISKPYVLFGYTLLVFQ
jgi:hypothetical protein